MDLLANRILQNLAQVRERMDAAARRAGRDGSAVQLVAVTKSVGIEEISVLIRAGCTHFGENRVETAASKIAAISKSSLVWHMIGNLQRRKIPQVLEHFQTIDAVDRMNLFDAIQQRCENLDTSASVLIEVNVSGEAAKHGFALDELEGALRKARECDRIQVSGLMTMAPFGALEADVRGYFRTLRERTLEHGLIETSMGMTQDFEWAIEEGATQVRVGSALFA